ncbi:hypothetical protein DKX38_030102 (mitochondrion) [Salix brachista]|uniref:ATP-dependent Clp protease proteolytic subunit n=1 Tax=Salix brachista TaxID=2182728 RepID=A0A5N5J853_9ROSI|nr:hypothetical protein DKX38_030102 [Salix brachista]
MICLTSKTPFSSPDTRQSKSPPPCGSQSSDGTRNHTAAAALRAHLLRLSLTYALAACPLRAIRLSPARPKTESLVRASSIMGTNLTKLGLMEQDLDLNKEFESGRAGKNQCDSEVEQIICPGSGRTTETARNPHKGLCTKNRQTLMLWVVSEDMERDVFMSAAEAQVHGIVDLVAVA